MFRDMSQRMPHVRDLINGFPIANTLEKPTATIEFAFYDVVVFDCTSAIYVF
jgi:hypothetical protein